MGSMALVMVENNLTSTIWNDKRGKKLESKENC